MTNKITYHTQPDVLRILAVDDDYDDFMFLEDTVKAFPFPVTVTHLSKSTELMNVLSHNQFDLIFLDLVMPMKDGMECLEEIMGNKDYKHIPVIVLTGNSDPEQIEKSRRLGAMLHLVKPFCVKDMSMITHHLSQQYELKNQEVD